MILNPYRFAAAGSPYFFEENFNGTNGCSPNNLSIFNEAGWTHLNTGSVVATPQTNALKVNEAASSIKTPLLLVTAPFHFYFKFYTPWMTRSSGLSLFVFWSRTTGGGWGQRGLCGWGGSSAVWRWNNDSAQTWSAGADGTQHVWFEFTGTQFKWYSSANGIKPGSPATTRTCYMYDEHTIIFNGQSYWQNKYMTYSKMRGSTSPIGDNPD